MQACGWPGADVQGTGCTATCWIFVRPHEAICLWSIVHLRVQAALQESPTLEEALAQRMLAAVQVGHLLLLVCVPRHASCPASSSLHTFLQFLWAQLHLFRTLHSARQHPCADALSLMMRDPQAAQQQERFAIFVEAPRCEEQYVSLNRRTQPYNRLVRGCIQSTILQ